MVVLKTLHVACVVLWLGNFVVSGVWSIRAFLAGNATLRRFAVREIIFTDVVFTLVFGSAVIASGIALSFVEGFRPWAVAWTRWALILSVAGGLAWLFLLIPLELRMGRIARTAAGATALVRAFFWWNVVGWTITVVLFGIIYLMVAKPA